MGKSSGNMGCKGSKTGSDERRVRKHGGLEKLKRMTMYDIHIYLSLWVFVMVKRKTRNATRYIVHYSTVHHAVYNVHFLYTCKGI
jgi:hypothetical protein